MDNAGDFLIAWLGLAHLCPAVRRGEDGSDPTTLNWNSTDGVDFTYQVSGTPVPAKTTVGLYWASGPTLADALEPIDKPIVSQAIRAGQPVGSYGPFHIDVNSSHASHWD